MGEALVKGLYLQSALDLVKERGGAELASSIAQQLQIERVWSFRDYPAHLDASGPPGRALLCRRR